MLGIAYCTDDLLHILPNKLVAFFGIAQSAHGLVVTVTASENLITAWRSKFAPSPIMLASVKRLSIIFSVGLIGILGVTGSCLVFLRLVDEARNRNVVLFTIHGGGFLIWEILTVDE